MNVIELILITIASFVFEYLFLKFGVEAEFSFIRFGVFFFALSFFNYIFRTLRQINYKKQS